MGNVIDLAAERAARRPTALTREQRIAEEMSELWRGIYEHLPMTLDRERDRRYQRVKEAIERMTPRTVANRLVHFAGLFPPEERLPAMQPLLDAMQMKMRTSALRVVSRCLSVYPTDLELESARLRILTRQLELRSRLYELCNTAGDDG